MQNGFRAIRVGCFLALFVNWYPTTIYRRSKNSPRFLYPPNHPPPKNPQPRSKSDNTTQKKNS